MESVGFVVVGATVGILAALCAGMMGITVFLAVELTDWRDIPFVAASAFSAAVTGYSAWALWQ